MDSGPLEVLGLEWKCCEVETKFSAWQGSLMRAHTSILSSCQAQPTTPLSNVCI